MNETLVAASPPSEKCRETPVSRRGFCGIGIWYPEKECNVGTLFRSAVAFGANATFTIGRKYRQQSSDTCGSPRSVPCYNYHDLNDFLNHLPMHSRLVCVELSETAHSLPSFVHPEQAIYLLGSEGGGLPSAVLKEHLVVQIPTKLCLNVATAGSIVLYDRAAKTARRETYERPS